MMTDDELAAARALCDAATPGPWHRVDSPWGCSDWVTATKSPIGDPHGGIPIADCDVLTDEDGCDPPDYQAEANATFIAAARTGWPAALDEVERLLVTSRDARDERVKALRIMDELLGGPGHAGIGLVEMTRAIRDEVEHLRNEISPLAEALLMAADYALNGEWREAGHLRYRFAVSETIGYQSRLFHVAVAAITDVDSDAYLNDSTCLADAALEAAAREMERER